MSDVLILSACRTPIGKFRGALSRRSAVELGAAALTSAVERAGVQAPEIDEVILGCVLTAGMGQAPARQAALRAGLPPHTPALTINKVCGSGLKAVMLAAQAIRCGDAELVVAGGMESMSQAGYMLSREAPPLGDRALVDTLQHDGLTCAISGRVMGDIAEGVAQQHGLTRRELDEFAIESHRRACAAAAMGQFCAETVPVDVPHRGEMVTVDRDEGPRPDTSLERLAALPPAFRRDGLVTAGNSSMISDGAAALVLGSESAAKRSGVQPLARVVATATVGVHPEELFTAPVEAIRQVVVRAKRTLPEVDLFEVNEAFAAQLLACVRPLDIPLDRVNVHGGAIALGHPIGASAARVLVTLLHALQRHNGRIGVAAVCLGGGGAVAVLVERC
uniref:Thiolase family protein n=1 Tax=Schlesneria paludicola TaxID=360056 RepID=A0A7C2PGN1_9PLAN